MLTLLLRRLLISIATWAVLAYLVWHVTTPAGLATLRHPGLGTLWSPDFADWLRRALHGDLGYSLRLRAPVLAAMRARAPVTLMLVVPAFVLQEALALVLGVVAAARHRALFDRLASQAVAVGAALPVFWTALVAVIVFGVQLHWVPFGGLIDLHRTGTIYGTPEFWAYFRAHPLAETADIAAHLSLPVLVLVVAGAAQDTALVRVSMLEALGQEYIRAARARGLRQRTVVWGHALRNALLPLTTSLGTQLPALVFTAAIAEFIFSLPGLGNLFISAAYIVPNSHDQLLPADLDVISGYFLVLGTLAIVVSALTDVAYALVDPRIRQR